MKLERPERLAIDVALVIALLYPPLTYVAIEYSYYKLRSGDVQIRGILAYILCALVSLTPVPLSLILFNGSCNLMQQEISKQAKRHTKRQGAQLEGVESRDEKIIDPTYFSNCSKIMKSFDDLKSAWSPMIAVTFATESVLLISSGFAISNEEIEQPTKYEIYLQKRDSLMNLMCMYCILYFLSICWLAEATHRFVKNFGSKLRLDLLYLFIPF